MIKLEPIREPYWKYKAFGIADHKIVDDFTVECTYRDKNGNRLYPNPFKCSKGKAKVAPTQNIKGTLLRIIPINQMEEIVNENND